MITFLTVLKNGHLKQHVLAMASGVGSILINPPLSYSLNPTV